MVSEHAAEFGISIIPVTGFEYEILMEDYIMAISKEPVDLWYIDLATLKQKFYVAQFAWESILPILEQNRIKDHGCF